MKPSGVHLRATVALMRNAEIQAQPKAHSNSHRLIIIIIIIIVIIIIIINSSCCADFTTEQDIVRRSTGRLLH